MYNIQYKIISNLTTLKMKNVNIKYIFIGNNTNNLYFNILYEQTTQHFKR